MSCIAIAINNFIYLSLLLLFFCITVMISDNIFTYTHKIATFLLTSRCCAYVTLYIYILVRTHWIQAFHLFAKNVLYGKNWCKTLTFISNHGKSTLNETLRWKCVRSFYRAIPHFFFSFYFFIYDKWLHKQMRKKNNDTLIIHFYTYE